MCWRSRSWRRVRRRARRAPGSEARGDEETLCGNSQLPDTLSKSASGRPGQKSASARRLIARDEAHARVG